MSVEPDEVTAVVVGIERYDAGDTWNLPGAAAGALRIAAWLRGAEVPGNRITTMLHPIDEAATTASLDRLAIPAGNRRAATVDGLLDLVDHQLFVDPSPYLLLFWAGHGVMDALRDRRLFLPRSTFDQTHCLSVDRLLARLADERMAGLGRQLILVDSCASNQDDMRLSAQPTEVALGLADRWRPPADGFVQDALLASAQGEVADLAVGSGLFSDVVVGWLEAENPGLPPPFADLERAITTGFERLRADGATRQHPVSIRVAGALGSEREHTYGGGPVSQPAYAAARAAGLTTGQVRRLSEVLAGVPQLATEAGRDALAAAIGAGAAMGADPGVGRPVDEVEDAERLLSRAIAQGTVGALVEALVGLAAAESEEVAAVRFRHRWELELAVRPLLEMLRGVTRSHLVRALEETLGEIPATHRPDGSERVDAVERVDGIEPVEPGRHCWSWSGPADLDEVLAGLADHPQLGRAVPPLVEFVVRLRHRRPDLPVPDGWYADQGVDREAVDALVATIEAEDRSPRKLVIDLRGSGEGRWQDEVSGYLGPGWTIRRVRCRATEDGVRCAVRAIVEWARSRSDDLTIGFVVARDLARRSPGEWDYEDEVTLPDPLCVQHPVVLHAAERLRIPQLQPAWTRKLADIDATIEAEGPSVLWVRADDARRVRRSVQQSRDAYVALCFVPEVRDEPRAEAVMAALAGGAPHVVWVEQAWAEGYDLEGELERLIGPLGDFAAAVLEQRLADPYLSSALRVIWDRDGELPPFIDRFGEEL